MRRAALGFRAHSGWACAILFVRSQDEVEVADRRRIELCDAKIAGSRQPFHQAESMTFAEAEAYLARCAAATDDFARRAVAQFCNVAREANLRLVGACILTASGKPLPDLPAILASHALIHAAEGEFFRDALARACRAQTLKVSRLKEKEATPRMAERLGISEGALKARLAEIGKPLGPPWSEDQKLASLAAWSVLAG